MWKREPLFSDGTLHTRASSPDSFASSLRLSHKRATETSRRKRGGQPCWHFDGFSHRHTRLCSFAFHWVGVRLCPPPPPLILFRLSTMGQDLRQLGVALWWVGVLQGISGAFSLHYRYLWRNCYPCYLGHTGYDHSALRPGM